MRKAVCLSIAVSVLLLQNGYAVVPSVGPDVNLTRGAGNQYETTVAINPNNKDQIFVASRNEVGGLYTARSSDGGLTWTGRLIGTTPFPAEGDIPRAYGNASAAWDAFGNLFLAYLLQASQSSGTYVAVAVSIDGGASFYSPAGTGSVLLLPSTSPAKIGDQPTVAVGPGSGGDPGSVWVTYWSQGGIWVSGAGVSGHTVGTFNSQLLASQPPAVNFGDIAVGPNGEVMVTYGPNSGVSKAIYINVDPDGLGPSPFSEYRLVVPVNVGGFTYIPAQPNWGIDPEAGLAYDRSNGSHHGRVYLVYTDTPTIGSYDTNIFVVHSDDQGGTWSAPVRVNDDLGENSQFLPHISLDQSSGAVAVTWYDARNAASNDTAQYFGALSTDGGATFSPNFQISTGTSDQARSVAALKKTDYGDYTGNGFVGGRLVPAWGDNSNSTRDNPDGATNFDVYTAIVELSSDTTPPIVSNAAVTPDPLPVNTSSTLTADISDATTGGSSIASAEYSIDAGAPAGMALAPSGAVTVAASATLPPFSQSGLYNVCVRGTDSAGNTSGDACVSLPVYDPSAGFVTGSGTIPSAAGADSLDPSASGTATFAFVSKYQKAATAPKGNLTFQFRAGDLDFKSTSMDWLVLTGGPKAMFHGAGVVNGLHVCQFQATAWDDSFAYAGTKTDAFGIKIYSCSSGGDGVGNRYSTDAAPLSGGSIIIHQ